MKSSVPGSHLRPRRTLLRVITFCNSESWDPETVVKLYYIYIDMVKISIQIGLRGIPNSLISFHSSAQSKYFMTWSLIVQANRETSAEGWQGLILLSRIYIRKVIHQNFADNNFLFLLATATLANQTYHRKWMKLNHCHHHCFKLIPRTNINHHCNIIIIIIKGFQPFSSQLEAF